MRTSRIKLNQQKGLIILILFIILGIQSIVTNAIAQRIVVAAEGEYLVTGPQYGASSTMETNGRWGVGIFYQGEISGKEEMLLKKNFFAGVRLQAPLVKSRKLSFFGNVRCGLKNEKFLVVVPGLETQITVTNRVGVAFGMSMRMSHPAISGKIFFNL